VFCAHDCQTEQQASICSSFDSLKFLVRWQDSVVNSFSRLNIQQLGVNSIMCCDALVVTMYLVVLHVTGYSTRLSQNLALTYLSGVSTTQFTHVNHVTHTSWI
jgi:hypothetical protein